MNDYTIEPDGDGEYDPKAEGCVCEHPTAPFAGHGILPGVLFWMTTETALPCTRQRPPLVSIGTDWQHMNVVERCDACCRYPNDDAAHDAVHAFEATAKARGGA